MMSYNNLDKKTDVFQRNIWDLVVFDSNINISRECREKCTKPFYPWYRISRGVNWMCKTIIKDDLLNSNKWNKK